MSPTSTYTDLNNARHDDQRAVMEKLEETGQCPFCWDYLFEHNLEPMLAQGTYWVLTPNHWPYDHVKHQWLFIYRDHLEDLSQVNPAAMPELLEMIQTVLANHQVKGGALCMRFGDTRHSAGSVKHLHAQLIVPDVDQEDFQPVRFKIGSGKGR